MAKRKLIELDIVRAIAILAVLTIHGTSEATVELPSGSIGQSIYLAINKLSNFAVPVFIFLSGLVLFYRYSGDWGARQAAQFYRKRIQQIVIPYLIWSFFYYIYDQWLVDRTRIRLDWREFAELLPWSDAAYHLYFIVIIVQFYLLFPLLMTLCARFVWFRRLLWLVGLTIQVVFYEIQRYGYSFEHSASLCATYFSLFTLGGFIGLYYDAFVAWLGKHIGWIAPAALLCGGAFMMLFELEQWKGIYLPAIWYELLFNLYPILASAAFIWFGRLLTVRVPRLSQALLALGAASFGIYLVHPSVLSFWRTYFLPEQVGGYHVYTVTGFLLSMIIPWLLVLGYGRMSRVVMQKKVQVRA
ncbi:acyltransferase [Paenibacillus hamazuiensis]|uniref:acyltransferase n=1 Tax=Paenibacillus hamazuiensis TaxID=2936508 RepID=UPI00200F8DF5|nr:acyltransferase [Paenibacillus hamazuiensis]